MNKTAIEWVFNPDGSRLGYSWNPITGCLNGCPYCYARRLANGRLKARYLANKNLGFDGGAKRWLIESDPFYPRFWPEKLIQVYRPKLSKAKPRGIFVCDMSDLFGIGIPEGWTRQVMDAIRSNPIDRFYLLTKQPQNLAKFSPFPDNCFVGASATDYDMFVDACVGLARIEATTKFISLEPLLGWDDSTGGEHFAPDWMREGGISWVLIGQQTPVKASTAPKVEWVEEIVKAADKAGIPVFLKNNLLELVNYESPETDFAFDKKTGEYRQEVPK